MLRASRLLEGEDPDPPSPVRLHPARDHLTPARPDSVMYEGPWLSGLLRAKLLDPRIHAVLTILVYALLRVNTSSFGPRGRV